MSSHPTPEPVASRYRWTICALLFAATTINYMDRQILGLLAPVIQKDIGWTELEYSRMNSVFYALYAVGVIGFGRLIDRFGTKVSYAGAMVFWSLAAIAHAGTRTLFGFASARALLGLGEAGNFPSCIKAITEWFPKRERAFATGIFNSGSNFGAVFAPAVIPPLGAALGWRTTYVIVGALGFLWLLAWLPFFHKPSRSRFVNAAELAHIEGGAEEKADTATIGWWSLIGRRQTWAFMLGKFLTDPIWWFYLLWVPKWLNSTRGLDLMHVGLPIIVIYLIATVGSVGGGWLSSSFLRRGMNANRARKLTMLLCACGVLPVMFVSQVENLWLAVVLIGVAAASHQGWSANLFTTSSDMFPKQAVGSVVGLGTMAGAVGMMVFGEVIGRVLDQSGNYGLLFVVCASTYLVALALFHLLAPRLARVETTA